MSRLHGRPAPVDGADAGAADPAADLAGLQRSRDGGGWSRCREVVRRRRSTQGAYWVIEGSIPEKIPGAIAIGGKYAGDIAKEFYPKAKGVIAIGSCACFGNVQARTPNPTGAMGVGKWLREKGGIPDAKVVNLPRCPGNGDDLVATLVYILVNGKLPDFDDAGRPLFLYGQTIHDTCERRAHFEAGEFVEQFGDEGSLQALVLLQGRLQGPGHVRTLRHQPLERPRVVVHPLRAVHGLLGRQLLERLQPAA